MIFERHTEWQKLAQYCGADAEEVDDIVQNVYLKIAEIQFRDGSLAKLTHYSGGLNMIYIFKIIQTCTIDQKRAQRAAEFDFDEPDEYGDPELVENEYASFMEDVKRAIDNLSEYEIMMLELHFVYGHSMREIEKRTGIPTHSVFNTLKNAKQKIKHETEAKYRDYCLTKYDQERGARPRGRRGTGDESDWD